MSNDQTGKVAFRRQHRHIGQIEIERLIIFLVKQSLHPLSAFSSRLQIKLTTRHQDSTANPTVFDPSLDIHSSPLSKHCFLIKMCFLSFFAQLSRE